MCRPVILILGVILLSFVTESISQRFILPTYRPPRKRNPVIIRTVRQAGSESHMVFKGIDMQQDQLRSDRPYLPLRSGSDKLVPYGVQAQNLKNEINLSFDTGEQEIVNLKESVDQFSFS